MCLAIPGQVKEVYSIMDGQIKMGKVNFGGIVKEVNLEMLPEAEVGDYVLVHVGLAISRVDEEEALQVLEYLRQMGELEELNPPDAASGAEPQTGA